MKNLLIKSIIVVLSLVMFQITIVQASTVHQDVINFYEAYSEITNSWDNTKIKRIEKIYGVDDQIIGTINRVFDKNNVQQGYILHYYERGVVEATFEGQDSASDINGKVYHILPGQFLSKQEYKDQVDYYLTLQENYISNLVGASPAMIFTGDATEPETIDLFYTLAYINSTNVPDLSSNTVSDSSPYHYRNKIEDVPDYMNFPDADFNNACGPVSMANVIAYFDREYDDDFSEHEGFWDKHDLTHDGDADDLINDLGDYMGNCIDFTTGATLSNNNCHGVSVAGMGAAMNNYFDDNGLGEWELYTFEMSDHFNDYKALINLGNPVVLSLFSHPTYGNHAVTGIGYMVLNGAPSGVYIHDNWQNNATTGKEVWINTSEVSYFSFIYD